MASRIPPGFMASFADGDVVEWEARSDVLYHFNCIEWFSKDTAHGSLILVNLDDADVYYYNRVTDMTRGLKNPHKLAEYLLNFTSTHPDITAYGTSLRGQFIWHVHQYNKTCEPRRRLFISGLSPSELGVLEKLANDSLNFPIAKGAAVLGPDKKIIMATRDVEEIPVSDSEAKMIDIELRDVVTKCSEQNRSRRLTISRDLKGFVVGDSLDLDSIDI